MVVEEHETEEHVRADEERMRHEAGRRSEGSDGRG
jgi:hypothetical protein